MLWQARREDGRGIQVAGGTMHNGYKMDIHSRTVADSTLALLDHVLGRAPCVNAVVFEMLKEAIPAMGWMASPTSCCGYGACSNFCAAVTR